MPSSEASEHLKDPDFPSHYVSLFTPRDSRSLRVNFRSARNADEVILKLCQIIEVFVTMFLLISLIIQLKFCHHSTGICSPRCQLYFTSK
jgi:hypothetical protein